MPKVFTARSVEQAKPDPSRRLEIPDGLLTGLYLVIQPSGAKSWAVRYRHGGKPRKATLGPFPALDLGEARDAAKQALQAVAKGDDPAAMKRTARSEAAEGRDLFKVVAAEFLKRHCAGKRSKPEIERMLNHDVLPHWGERRIQDITRRDVIELMDRLTDRGVGSMTNRVFSIIRKLFNWCISRDLLTVSPCAGIRPPVPEVRRDRVLSDHELRWFWKAADRRGMPFGPLFKILALTGQRLSEVAEMAPGEVKVKERLWTIPKARVKNNSEHDVALSDAALAILDAMPKIKGDAGHVYVFTTTGDSPVSGWSRAKNNLDKTMLEIARQEAEEAGDDPAAVRIPQWRLHDLRRTAASGMARLGINLPVIEKVLNHTSGSFAGIVGVYQRHSFADEKRAALEAWSRLVVSLVKDAPADNVVPMRA
jgi:integrase